MDQLFEVIVSFAITVITVFVLPYLRSKTTAAQQKQLEQLVSLAVMAAEQIIPISGNSEKKRSFVYNYLDNAGISYNPLVVRTMLESAVFALPKRSVTK